MFLQKNPLYNSLSSNVTQKTPASKQEEEEKVKDERKNPVKNLVNDFV